jgi:Domain of unknown function (DUF4267)
VTLAAALSTVTYIAAGFLGLCGVLMLKRGEQALAMMAHTRASLVQTFAGRYLAMAFMLLGLTVFHEWRALAIVLTVGGLMGLLDYHYVGKAGGWVLPHAIAGIACFVLAAGAYSLSPA